MRGRGHVRARRPLRAPRRHHRHGVGPAGRRPGPLALLRERSVALLHPRSGAGGYAPGSGAFEHALRLVERGDVDVAALISHRLAGIEALPEALAITGDKRRYGALGPAQVDVFDWDRA
ncbi:hypothetical protein [Dactylosporangium darangshiense]|uniref:hypothetical protein n=1 Tax=Dactylosporangium darangshiense TaxID=579108 RepID=UPI0036447EB2